MSIYDPKNNVKINANSTETLFIPQWKIFKSLTWISESLISRNFLGRKITINDFWQKHTLFHQPLLTTLSCKEIEIIIPNSCFYHEDEQIIGLKQKGPGEKFEWVWKVPRSKLFISMCFYFHCPKKMKKAFFLSPIIIVSRSFLWPSFRTNPCIYCRSGLPFPGNLQWMWIKGDDSNDQKCGRFFLH